MTRERAVWVRELVRDLCTVSTAVMVAGWLLWAGGAWEKVKAHCRNDWVFSQEVLMLTKLERSNPTLRVPDAYEVKREAGGGAIP